MTQLLPLPRPRLGQRHRELHDLFLERFGVPSRRGVLRTIAAMHHQTNQVVVTSLMRRVLAGKYRDGDIIKIKYLAAPGVRNDPNLEPIPICKACGEWP